MATLDRKPGLIDTFLKAQSYLDYIWTLGQEVFSIRGSFKQDEPLIEHGKNVSKNRTLGANHNAISVGEVIINSDVKVVIPSTSRWVIV